MNLKTPLNYALILTFLLMGSWVRPLGATADGPDFFAVTGVAPNDVLNIREGPSAEHKKIGAIPHDGRKIKNLGCQGGMSFAQWEQAPLAQRAKSAKARWCKVEYQGLTGWVAARYLREDSE
jgi:uncharacterized protein YraI